MSKGPIKSMTEFMTAVEASNTQILATDHHGGEDKKVVYVGIRDSSWPPIPSLYYETKGTVLASNRIERELIHSVSYRYPSLFDADHPSSFRNLAKLRHYEVPVRLLDVTTNPFVALYFACRDAEQNNGKDKENKSKVALKQGAVHLLCFGDENIYDWMNPFFPEMIALAFEADNITAKTVRRISPRIAAKLEKNIASQNAWNNLSCPKLVKSPYFTSRQSAQHGQFVFFPPLFEVSPAKSKRNVKRVPLPGFVPNGTRNPLEYNKQMKSADQILVDPNSKSDIIKNLDKMMGINRINLFPEDVDSGVKAILFSTKQNQSTFWDKFK